MKRSICLIDDDEDVRIVMVFALEYEGMQTMAFANANDALKSLSSLTAEQLPSLIVVDYTMPQMNGVEFIHLMMNDYPLTLGKIPVALCSAHNAEDIKNVPSHVHLLEKPMDLQKFLDLAKSLSDGQHRPQTITLNTSEYPLSIHPQT